MCSLKHVINSLLRFSRSSRVHRANFCTTSRFLGEAGIGSTDKNVHVVDLRTDCLSQPTSDMLKAMTRATFHDDVFNEDPTVHELQNKVADLFGMEAALFVVSGTMGNLISVLCHCDRRGLEVIFGDMAHLFMYEQGGVAQLGGVAPRTIPNKLDGTFDLGLFESYIRPNNDPHQPITGLVAIENTHANCGGKVLPMEFITKLRSRTKELTLPLHMDGARIMNAAVATNIDVKEILKHVDSVSMCLSKGIGAPVGSVIGGSAEFIAKAVRMRKVLGGGWRKPGPLAAAALEALSGCRERIAQDHRNAKTLAQGIMEKHNNVVDIDLDAIHSNIVMIKIVKPGLTAAQFTARLNMITPQETSDCGQDLTVVRSLVFYKYVTRMILCNLVGAEDVVKALRKILYVLNELAQ